MDKSTLSPIKLFRKPGKSTPKLHFVCIHHAVGSAPIYLNWQANLPDFVEIAAIQLPGRGDTIRSPALDDIQLAAQETALLIDKEINGPYILFGHSLGTLIGFEAIRYLDKNQQKLPAHFFASGLSAPHVFTPKERRDLFDDTELTKRIALYDKGRVTQDDMYYQLLKLILPTARSDFKMHDTYQYSEGKLLPCDITAVCGMSDESHKQPAVEAWGELTSKKFSAQFFAGGHMYFFENRDAFLKWLSNEITKISENL